MNSDLLRRIQFQIIFPKAYEHGRLRKPLVVSLRQTKSSSSSRVMLAALPTVKCSQLGFSNIIINRWDR